jgi:large subunit ribosomal protein L11
MKKITGQVKIQAPGGEAKPGPPIGPVLGQHGVNIPMFIKEFNAKTAELKGYIVPVVITVFSDKSFTLQVKTPPTSVLLAKAAKSASGGAVDKGSARPNRDKVGKVDKKTVLEIAKRKLPDLNTEDLDAAVRSVMGTARSMGIEIAD